MKRFALIAVAAFAAACGGGSKKAPATCYETGCPTGQSCESVQNAAPACFSPVLLRGGVSDPTTAPATLLNGARVVALDSNRAPMSTVATSANNGTSDGQYELQVRAARDASGKPLQTFVTLNAAAQGYATFPSGIRPALPIDLSKAVSNGANWVVDGTVTGAATDIELLPAANASATAQIHGSVTGGPSGSGVLVVAVPVGGGAGVSGIADGSGNFVVFNLLPGTTYVVTAYVKGANYTPVTTAALAAGDNAVAALGVAAGAGAAFSGNLIPNNNPNPNFQVTLVPDSTYVVTLDRGDSVPGLTVDVAGWGTRSQGSPTAPTECSPRSGSTATSATSALAVTRPRRSLP